MKTKLLLILSALLITLTTAHAAPPVNDNKANATVLTGDTATGSANNVEATKETGDWVERMVWWKWTASGNGRVTLNTAGSGAPNVAIVAYLVEGGATTGTVDSDSKYGATKPLCAFPVTQGSVYLIGVGAPDTSVSSAGNLTLTITLNRSDPVGAMTLPHAATMTNDSFANRKVLTGTTVSAVSYNVSATREISEPTISGYSTLWWTYRAPATGRLTISTAGSDTTNYNSSSSYYKRVMIYMGTSLDTLRVIDGGANSIQETITLPVTANTDYQISFGSYDTDTGSLVLTCSLNTTVDVASLNIPNAATMANDSFAQRINLVGDTVSAIAYNTDATREDTASEPAISGYKTLWWTYQPTKNGRLTITTQGSDTTNYNSNSSFYKRVVVYLGTTLANLQMVDMGPDQLLETVSLPVTAGITYVISVGSYDSDAASLVLTLSLDKTADVSALNIPSPATTVNDSFASRRTLSGNTVSAISYLPPATRETNEPTIAGEHSVWWTYRPTATGRLSITTQGSDTTNYNSNGSFYKRVVVYQGTSLQTLKVLDVGYDRTLETLTIPVTAGTDYQISIGSYDNDSGSLVLTLSLDTSADVAAMNIPNAATMVNDAFANRLTLSGNNVSAIAYNVSATREDTSSEPTLSGNNTLWWTYRPATTGRLTITTQGSDTSGYNYSSSFYKRIVFYLGSTLQTLKPVAVGPGNTIETVSLPVTANTDYQISVGSDGTTTGSLVLTLVLDSAADVSALNIPNTVTMANDAFANRVPLAGNNVSAIGYTLAATREALEPSATGERTIWWSWTSPVTGQAILDFTGTGVSNLTVSAWQGATISSLSRVTLDNFTGWQTSFDAVAGQTYQIAAGTPYTGVSGSSIVMTIFGPPSKPIFATPLPSQWLSLGAGLSLTGSAGNRDVTYRWQRNGSFIAGAMAQLYTVPAVTLADAGAYKVEAKNSLGTTLSGAANIGVMDDADRGVQVGEGSTMKLTVPAAGPAGALSYRWLRNGLDLADGKVGTQVIAGAGSATLSISGFTSANTGTYACRVTLANAADSAQSFTRTSGDFTVDIVMKPVVTVVTVPAAEVAKAFTWQLAATNLPTSFAVTGLPAGLQLAPATGLVTGTPTVSGPGFTVKVTASNLAGVSAVQNFTLPVAAIRTGLATKYAGVVNRQATLNASLGGTISADVATSGSLTGTLKLGSLSYALKGNVVVPATGNASASLSVARTASTPLTVSLSFAANGTVSGSVGDGTNSAALTAGANPWRAATATQTANQPLAMAGAYNVQLDLPLASDNDPSVPQGCGYLQLAVTGTTGAVTITGRTADGAVILGSGIVWADGRVPLYTLLYANRGSIRGLPKINLGGAAPAYLDNRVAGSVDWQKTGPASTADRSYAAGYGPIALVVNGSKWVKPLAGTMLFGWPNQANNLRVEFTDGGLGSVAQAGQISQTGQLLTTGAVRFNALTAGNPTGVVLTLNTSTGLFSGSFTLTDPKLVGTGTQTRKVSYSGLLVSHLSQGYGYFMLPGLAAGADVLGGEVLVKVP